MFEPGQMISPKEGQICRLFAPILDDPTKAFTKRVFINSDRLVMFLREVPDNEDEHPGFIVLYEDTVWLADNSVYFVHRDYLPFKAGNALRVSESADWQVRSK